MKLGAENKNKVIAAVGLTVLAVVVLAYEVSGWFGSSSASTNSPPPPPPNVAVNLTPRQRANPANRNVAPRKDPGQSLDPSLRFDLLKSSEETKYEGTGRNIFRVFVEIPHIVQAPVPRRAQQQPAEHSTDAGMRDLVTE